MVPDAALIDRFARDLDALIPSGARVGVAVSGGADSLALLLLAAAARPAAIEAATVDHGFRAESRGEAETVAAVCSKLGIPHAILDVRWREKPKTAIQERARQERYRLLGFWAEERGLRAVATGHHADDQAETFLMRLNRGAGVRGLAGMRPRSIAPGTDIRLIRPLLRWRHSELEDVCAAAHLTPAVDSSNDDAQFERVRLRQSLAAADWLDPAAIAGRRHILLMLKLRSIGPFASAGSSRFKTATAQLPSQRTTSPQKSTDVSSLVRSVGSPRRAKMNCAGLSLTAWSPRSAAAESPPCAVSPAAAGQPGVSPWRPHAASERRFLQNGFCLDWRRVRTLRFRSLEYGSFAGGAGRGKPAIAGQGERLSVGRDRRRSVVGAGPGP